MRKIKQLLAFVLTFCMVLGVMPAAYAQEVPVLANEDEVVVYYTNDVHTYIDGDISYDQLADLKTQTAAQAAGVLLVDAGDAVQGTAYGSMDKGETIVELMNASGYDLATLGNHEFDYGMDGCMNVIDWADFPYISANFSHINKANNSFEDVHLENWFYNYVLDLNIRGIINGRNDTTFAPDDNVKRSEFVTMLYRIWGNPDVSGLSNQFTDVTGDWYKDAVNWAVAEGITKGTSAKTFDPDKFITREQMVTMLYRAVGEPEVTGNLNGYKDGKDVTDWAQQAFIWATQNGVVNGMTLTTLAPAANATRSQAAKILDIYFYKDLAHYETVLDAYKVFEIDGKKIAFVGITTPESFTKSTPKYFQDENGNYIYAIHGGEDGSALYAAVQNAIDEVKRIHNPDYVIALAHLGDDPASQPWTSEEVIANTTGLDALIDGHSHSTVPMKEVEDKEGNSVVLTQTGEYFGAIGKMVIGADGSITTSLITEYTGSDAAVKAIKDEWIAEIDTKLGEVIGYAEVTFNNYDADGNRLVRKQETNTGDFAADALYYLFDNMGLEVDVAIMNGGGVRNKAITGDISYKVCKDIHTFGNVACLQTVTGQQILDALEWGARGTPDEEIGGFLHVSGITFEIHTDVPSGCTMDDKGVWTGHEGEYRVQNVKVLQDGEYVDLDVNAKYNLAGYNYTLRDLGDGFAMFDGAVNVLDYVMEDYMVLANYVKSFPEGKIPADSIYADVNGEGRITLVEENQVEDAIVYYTNDVHTYLDKTLSYDNIADLKAQTAAEGYDVLLVDAGDHIQGTAYGSMDKGATIIELMNAAGYDLATLGNHEFDYGMEGAMNVIDWAEFPYVSANFYHEEDGVKGENVLDAYQVFEIGGRKVAFIGATTPESFTKSTPAYFQDENGNYIYGIAGGTDGAELYAAVQEAIDAASEEADIVIALAHLGDDPASQPWTSEELIANTTGLDALIDGHSHSTVPMKEVADKDGNTVILTQTGEYFDAIGKMVIGADGSITTSLITEYTGSDAAVKAIKDEWIAEIDTQLGEVIGYAEVTFNNYDADGNRLVRKQETNTGDFAADALYYLFDNMGLEVDVAIMNGGGVRNKAITGDISYKVCKDIHTFGNVACLQTVTGQQILDALEWGARGTPDEEIGGFLHVSGITFEIHTDVPSGCTMDDKGVWTGHEGEYRVQNVKVLQDGEYVDLDVNAKYNLAGYNYTLRDLGDGFAMFDGAVNVLDYVMEDYMVLANYVKSFENGVIAADSIYADVNGNGRITIVSQPQ